jgi:amiloride-sensitive sodium channel
MAQRHQTQKQSISHILVEFCVLFLKIEIVYFSSIRITKVFLLKNRIWWLIALLASLYCCITLIISTYHKWETSPVIVSFATKETPIWQIPFPAVTICPEIKSVPKLFNYTDFLNKKLDGKTLSPQE